MEELIGLFCVAIAGFTTLVVPMVITVAHASLRARVVALEAAVAELQGALAAARARALEASERPAVAPTVAQAPPPPPLVVVPPVIDPAPPAPAEGPPVAARSEAGEPAGTAPHAPTADVAAAPSSTARDTPSIAPPPVAPPPVAPPPPPGPAAPRPQGIGIEAVGLWVLAAFGGVLFVLAGLFALREAIELGLLAPGLRLVVAATVATTAWLLAELLASRKYTVPADALAGVGVGVAISMVWAAHSLYGFLGPGPSAVLLTAITAITLALAALRDRPFIAVLAMFGGFATPVLLDNGENAAVSFFVYLLVLNTGLLVAASWRRWTTVVFLAGAATATLWTGWAIANRAPDQATIGLVAPLMFAVAFALASASRRAPATPRVLAPIFRGVALIAAVLVAAPAAAYLWPADPGALDRYSTLPLEWSADAAAWGGAAFLLGVTVALSLAARRFEGDERDRINAPRVLASILVGLAAATFALIHTVGWAYASEAWWAPALAGQVAVAAALVLGGSPITGAAVALVGAAVVFAAAVPSAPDEVWLAGCAVALAAPLVAVAYAGERRALLLPALAAAAIVLHAPLLSFALGRSDVLNVVTVERLGDLGASPLWLLASLGAYAAFAIVPFVRPRRDDGWGVLAAALAGAAFFLPLRAAWEARGGEGAPGVLAVGLGAVSLLSALTLLRSQRVREDDRQLALLVAAALGAAAVAVPLQLERHWLTIGWAIEVALLALVSRGVRHPLINGLAAVLTVAVLVRTVFNVDAWTWGGADGLPIVNWALYAWGVPIVCFLVAAERVDAKATLLRGLWYVIAVALGFCLLNIEVVHAFAGGGALRFTGHGLFASMAISVSWGAYGLMLIGVGSARDSRAVRVAGLGFAMLGAGKVFLFDLWSLDGLARIGSLGCLGLTLLVGAVAFQFIVLRERK